MFSNYEDCLKEIEAGETLDNIPFQHRTLQLCKKAMEMKSWYSESFKHIPVRHLTEEFILEAATNKRVNLRNIPEDKRTEKVVKFYISTDDCFDEDFSHIPKKYLTYELCFRYIDIYMFATLKNVPEKFRTFELCMKAINLYLELEHVPRKYLENEILAPQIYFKALKKGKHIDEIPQEFQTYEMYLFEASRNLDRVPERFQTEELYIENVKARYPLSAYQIPLKFYTLNLCLAYIEEIEKNKNINTRLYDNLRCIFRNLRGDIPFENRLKLFERLVRLNYECIGWYCFEEYVSVEMVKTLYKKDSKILKHVPGCVINKIVSAYLDGEDEKVQPKTEPYMCCICNVNSVKVSFNCGHCTCIACSKMVEKCPTCRCEIQTKTTLYI